MAGLGEGKFFDLVSFEFMLLIELENVTFAVIKFGFLKWFVKLFTLGFSCGFKLIMDGS